MFSSVFKDIYKNMKNYYSLRFPTPYPGEYKITIKLCASNSQDSISLLVNNYVPELLFTNDLKEFDTLYKNITGITDTISPNDFNSHKVYRDIGFYELKKEFDSLIFPNIKFHFNKTTIVDGTDKELINVINFMKIHQNIRVEVQGHTDNKGGLLYNEKLSQGRANKVKEKMVAQGIDAQRIVTIGYGETKPISTNETEDGRQLNRRVDFVLIK